MGAVFKECAQLRMVQTKSILLIVMLMFCTTVAKRHLTDRERILMLADDLEAVTYRGAGVSELQKYVDDMASFSAKTKHGLKDMPEVKRNIQDVLDVCYKFVIKLKKVVEDAYRNRIKDTQSFLVNCCKLRNGNITEDGSVFPFSVDHNKICLFSKTGKKHIAKLLPTKHLMETFKKNSVGLSIPTWQYFVMRKSYAYTYPAKPMHPCESVKSFFQSWFRGFGTRLREVVVVIDTSSRMSEKAIGRVTHLDFAKEVAKAILLYSNDKDRVAVITLEADKVYNLEDENSCFTREVALVTKAYHDNLAVFIRSLQASGNSSYMNGLKFAKFLLDQSKWKGRCRQVVLISAVEPVEEDVLSQFNAVFSQSSIITYTIDVGNSPKVRSILKNMSKIPATKPGLYIHINHNQAIIKQMNKYRVHAMMPTASEITTPSLSSPHQDPLGLGVVISIREHVFHNNEVVGAVGIDLRVLDIVYKNPELYSGINTYVFMFDRRDDATILHPRVCDMYGHSSQPNYVNIRALERAANREGILDRMIRGLTGHRNITTNRLISLGDMRYQGVHLVDVMAQYSWMPVSIPG